jgi:hypothetical protein
MQFRLETFKSENIENKNSSKAFNEKGGRNIFYTKILSNTNIGIEFFKPSL